ncbi:MAG: glycosyltransferase family 4 protein, partial [Rhizonema sp. PD37]|nr:glycosyltransferase family 4 protein [Rhizonema sp. PD37]
MAINLGEALRDKGHDVTLWCPYPLPKQTRWWQSFQVMRLKLDDFLDTQKPFDIIDIPASFITKKVNQSAPKVVARSVQPDILCILHSLNEHFKRDLKGIILIPFSYLYSFFQIFLVLQGWKRANYIFCLGSLEFLWMKKWFPWWRNKLSFYVNALCTSEQMALTQVKLQRQQPSEEKIRFLWIGRWVSLKGTDILLNFITKWLSLRPQDSFTIAGCHTKTPKQISSALFQSGQLRILPSFTRKELYDLLANHDVGLFTSKVEGWGLVLNEMLESGTPVFATPVGGVPDLQPFANNLLYSFPPTLELVPKI